MLLFSMHPVGEHPLHVTVTNIDYNAAEKNFDVAIKFFSDDFQGVLYHCYGKNVIVSKAEEITKNEVLINRYINDHLKFRCKSSDGLRLKFIKSTYLDGALWLYFKTKLPDRTKSFELTNSLMNDYYYDQTNLLFFNYKEKQQALSFNYNQTEKKITF